MNQKDFVRTLGWIYEHSPWVAERAWVHRPFGSLTELATAMSDEVKRAPRAEQLALIRAHPDLGARARMADASVREQAGAGLDQLTQPEYDELQELNGAYTGRFGFPFILAVRGKTKREVLDNIRERLANDEDAEWNRALAEIHRIALFRLQDTVEGS